MKKKRIVPNRLRILCILLSAALLTNVLGGCGREQESERPLSQRIPNNDEIVLAVRKGLREHAQTITVRFSDSRNVLDELNALSAEWVEEALAETDSPVEGDYIRYQLGGYENRCRYEWEDGTYCYTVTITPRYYHYLAQEEALVEVLADVMASFRFNDASTELEKVSAIYDYVCRTVHYDRVHRKNPYATLRSTAYSALVRHTATCQGYSVLLYRMLREAGLNVRVVTGSSRDDSLHAWNLVELDGKYYHLDATWDAGKEEYSCFLMGENDFADHRLGEEFQSRSFRAQYPLAATRYEGAIFR